MTAIRNIFMISGSFLFRNKILTSTSLTMPLNDPVLLEFMNSNNKEFKYFTTL